MKKLKTFLRKIYLYSVIILICIIFIECLTTIALKFNTFKNFNHSFLTFSFTEITNSNFLNLKKNISLKKVVNNEQPRVILYKPQNHKECDKTVELIQMQESS